jgi:hypothetical protein
MSVDNASSIGEIARADVIDVRDLDILASDLMDVSEDVDADEADRLDARAFLADLRDLLTSMGGEAEYVGSGGFEFWSHSNDVTLINEGYFQEYAKDYAEEIGAVNADARWPNSCIDWEQAADELRSDYTSAEIAGVTFYYR